MTPEEYEKILEEMVNDMCFDGVAIRQVKINEKGAPEFTRVDLKDFKMQEIEVIK